MSSPFIAQRRPSGRGKQLAGNALMVRGVPLHALSVWRYESRHRAEQGMHSSPDLIPRQKNVLDRRRWRTCEELRIAIVTWIERTYHRRRRQATLGRLTPIEFERS